MTSGVHKNLLDALAHLEHGDWQVAHDIVQRDESREACWVHGIVHVLEGDLDNARYWYRRANRPFSPDTAAEILAARQSLK
jgi:hypothetical protein